MIINVLSPLRLLYCDMMLAHVTGLSLFRCFFSACTFHWLILKIDIELSMVEGTGLYSPSEFPSMSCKFQEDGVALADAILFEQGREHRRQITSSEMPSINAS